MNKSRKDFNKIIEKGIVAGMVSTLTIKKSIISTLKLIIEQGGKSVSLLGKSSPPFEVKEILEEEGLIKYTRGLCFNDGDYSITNKGRRLYTKIEQERKDYKRKKEVMKKFQSQYPKLSNHNSSPPWFGDTIGHPGLSESNGGPIGKLERIAG